VLCTKGVLSLFCFFLSRQSVVIIIKVVLDQKHVVVKSLRINDSVKTVAKVVIIILKGEIPDLSLIKTVFVLFFFVFFFQKVDDFHHGIPMMTDDCTRLEYA